MNQKEPSQESEPNWESFYKGQEGCEPRPLFLNMLARYDGKSSDVFQKHVIDLGRGTGTETLDLLEYGWTVLAIDREPAAIERVLSKVAVGHQPRLQTMTAVFEDLQLPETDIIYASYSLPFCGPDCFDGLWVKINAGSRPGGRFSGQFFGIRDTWAENTEMTFHSAEQVAALLEQAFAIESLEETDEDGEALSEPKHWHLFDIIARKLL